MTIKDLRSDTRLSQSEFAKYFNIPIGTLQNWEQGHRTPPQYVLELIQYKIDKEGLNMLKANANGKYDVLNQSIGEWIEVDKEWLEGVNLKGISELRYMRGNKETLEAIPHVGPSQYYENIHGSWARNY